jgi:hypothetical protein
MLRRRLWSPCANACADSDGGENESRIADATLARLFDRCGAE